MYTDSGLTTPAPNGVYSDGVDVYTVTGGAGEVTATALCDNFTTTTTTTTTTTVPPTTTTTTSTTTTTTTAAPTTTSTTTTTTTAQIFVNFYGVMGDTSINTGVLYFSTDQVNWTPVAQPFSNTCGLIDSFLVNSGDTVYISIGDVSSTVYYYNAQTGTACPSNSPTYCGIGSMFSVVINSTTDIAITQYVSGGNIVPCDTGTSTTTTTTTATPTTTSTTTTTTTSAPTTTTTSTTTTTTTLFSNLFFDGSVSNCGYYITAIDVNSVVPTLTGGADVPFCTDGHNYNTTQTGTNETLNLTIGTFTLNGCITVVDSASNTFQQNVTGNGNLAFTGLTINNTTAVVITLADNAC